MLLILEGIGKPYWVPYDCRYDCWHHDIAVTASKYQNATHINPAQKGAF